MELSRMTTIELTDQWQALDAEPQYGGTVGGDGAGEAWSVRYGKKNADGTFAFITADYYSVDGEMRGWWAPDGTALREDEDERFSVENMTELLICTDPGDLGGTEVWSDYLYDDELMPYYVTEQYAEAAAKR